MSAEQHNLKNPAVKRILQEIKELRTDTSGDVVGEPLEDNIFEWQFAIVGAAGSEFESGIYHGRILLPPEYPFKPPSFMFQTPNGRFEVGTKLCLSISQHHPEQWQPSWSVRTALVALIAFMQTKHDGAIGGLSYSKEERIRLAIKSRNEPPHTANPVRNELIQELHSRLCEVKADPAAQGSVEPEERNRESVNEVADIQSHPVSEDCSEETYLEQRSEAFHFPASPVARLTEPEFSKQESLSQEHENCLNCAESVDPFVVDDSPDSQASADTEEGEFAAPYEPPPSQLQPRQDHFEDRMLNFLVVFLSGLIIALLCRKFVVYLE